jgi:hypothetical protein
VAHHGAFVTVRDVFVSGVSRDDAHQRVLHRCQISIWPEPERVCVSRAIGR